MKNDFLGFVSHAAPFDPRLVTVAGWDRLDALREEIEQRGLDWYDTAVVSPRLKAGEKLLITLQQHKDRRRADFNQWAAWLLERLAGRGIEWLYWNEPNLREFWPWPDPYAYVAAARDLWIRMPKGEQLLIGELSTFDETYFKGMLDAGCESVGTGYGLHPYGPVPIDAQVKAMRAYTKRPIFCTECWSDQITPTTAAAVAKDAGASCFIWYRWPCGYPDDPSFNQGVINPDGSPRPILQALMAKTGIIAVDSQKTSL